MMSTETDPRAGAGEAAGAAVADPSAARLLAFDTSTEVMAVAAAGPDGGFAWNGPGGAAASARLLPQIDAVLARAGLALADVQAIAFGRGPGAFTGLRTSCAVAQGLGFGLGRPLLPLDSLLIVAEDALVGGVVLSSTEAPVQVAVAMDARMDEIYGGVYRCSATGWSGVRDPALYALDDWNAVLEQEHATQLLAGTALAVFGTRLHRPRGIVLQSGETDRAAALLRLARQAFAEGRGIDAALALPLYLRDKVALTTAERAAARASAEAGAGAGASA